MDTVHIDQTNAIEIYVIKNSASISDETFRLLFRTLSPDRQAYVSKFRRASDYQRSVLGDALVKRMIQDRLGREKTDIEIIKNAYGKPYLKNYDHLHFNVSHSGDWIVGAVGNKPVGIDVEKIGTVNMDIAKRFFHPTEYNALMACCCISAQLSLFYDLWTLKESYIKAVGKGLSLPLDSFVLVQQDGEWAPVIGENGEPHYFKQYVLEEGYKLSVCGISPHFPMNTQFVTAEEL